MPIGTRRRGHPIRPPRPPPPRRGEDASRGADDETTPGTDLLTYMCLGPALMRRSCLMRRITILRSLGVHLQRGRVGYSCERADGRIGGRMSATPTSG